MKLIEALVGFVVLIAVLGGGLSFLYSNYLGYDNYLNKIYKDSVKISLYNYSDYFISQVNSSSTGYISIINNSFSTGASGDFYYECNQSAGNMIYSNTPYTAIFCTISVFNEKIYKYKIK